uniref:Uncharacterized protein n=1 Tax=Calcidiscus leptoporus TaxID=127549 RepID=A0A7S0J904_9EUKA
MLLPAIGPSVPRAPRPLATALAKAAFLMLLVQGDAMVPRAHARPISSRDRGDVCSADDASCLDSLCCSSPGSGCFKRPFAMTAKCIPYSELGVSASTCSGTVRGWECPGWEACADELGDCTESGCCAQEGYGCFKSPEREFAQCRKLPTDNHGKPTTCKDTLEWLCPGWESCAADHGDCTQSKCCRSSGFACWKKKFEHRAECRAEPDVRANHDAVGDHSDPFATCRDTDEWLCPGWERCSDPDTACTKSRCCNHGGFTCYNVHTHYAHCMRTDTCEQQVAQRLKSSGKGNVNWEQVSAVTCFVAERDEDLSVHFDRTEQPPARDVGKSADGHPQEQLIFQAAADTTAAVSRLGVMQQRLQEDMKALETLEARLQEDLFATMEERQRISLAEALIGIFLGVMLLTGISAFAMLWSRLRANELRYSGFNRQSTSFNRFLDEQHHVANVEVPTFAPTLTESAALEGTELPPRDSEPPSELDPDTPGSSSAKALMPNGASEGS